jgi:predicted transcriptional regulator
VTRSEIRHLVSRFFSNSDEMLVLNILEERGVDQNEIDRLKQLLEGSKG